MVDHRDAALLVEEALGRVVDPAVVRQAREDTPLSVLGLAAADAVCVADAIEDAAAAAGRTCRLGDADLATVQTVGDLVSVVVRAQSPTGEG